MIFTLVLFLALTGYYFLHVKKKQAYLISHNFRLLAAVGHQVDQSVTILGKVLGNLQLHGDFIAVLTGKKEGGEREKRRILNAIAPIFKDVKLYNRAWPHEREEVEAQRLRVVPEGYLLELLHKGESTLSGEVPLRNLLDPLFSSWKAFDALLLATQDGKVIYRQGASDLNITDLGPLLEALPGDRRREEGRRAEGEKAFSGFSRHFKQEISGESYRIFIQPVALPIDPTVRKTAQEPHYGEVQDETWLICGLVRESELLYKSMAVSSSVLALVISGLLLAVLSWPFVKLKLLGEKQRIHLHDVLLLGVSSVLGVAIVTLIVLDFYAFQKLKEQARDQLVRFAGEIDKRLEKEIEDAYLQLIALERRAQQDEDTLRALARKETTASKAHIFENQGSETIYYPAVVNFMLMDETGQQRLKWSPNSVVAPPIRVGRRQYFQRARNGDTWKIGAAGPFSLESIIGWTTGDRSAVLARPIEWSNGIVVSSLAIPMLSVIDPVLPPGFEFAIIDPEDQEENVLFHSNSERNTAENFFAETDRNRRLRSAVFAHRSTALELRYWGKDYLAQVKPIQGLPWTIVTLRDKQILRTVNLEWIMATILLILLYVSLFVLFLGAVARIRSRPWAGRFWPHRSQAHSYRELVFLLALLSLAFALAIRGLRGDVTLVALSAFLPLLALVIVDLRLHPHEREVARRNAAAFCGVAILAFAAMALFQAPLEAGFGPWFRWSIFGLLALVLGAAAFLPCRPQSGPYVSAQALRRHYAAVGALVLALVAVLPTIGFFETARKIQFESFIKHGQLRLALGLNARLGHLQKVARAQRKEPRDFLRERLLDKTGRDIYAAPFFGTTVEMVGDGLPSICRAGLTEKETKACACAPKETATLTSRFAEWLPWTSEGGVEMRGLLYAGASDGAWHWHPPQNGQIQLHSRTYPGGDLYVTSFPEGTGGKGSEEVPLMSAGLAVSPPGLVTFVVFLSLLILGLVLWVVRFVCRYVFLQNVIERSWSGRLSDLSVQMGRNIFLFRRGQETAPCEGDNLVRIHLEKLRDPASRGWAAELSKVRSQGDRDILVEALGEECLADKLQERVLSFLEELLEMTRGNVILVSSVNPARLISREGLGEEGASRPRTALQRRWQNLLSSFLILDGGLMRPSNAAESLPATLSPVLRTEAGNNPSLQWIALELHNRAEAMFPEELVEVFGERAERYYRTLWATCSREEHLVLEHLAEEGFVNEKNGRLVRQLMARGLVRRAPNLRLMNESFRRFVISSTCRTEVLLLEQKAAPSAWDRFRWPFFAGLAASLVFFFATQQAEMGGATVAITGLATGLPAMLQMLDLLGSSRIRGGG